MQARDDTKLRWRGTWQNLQRRVQPWRINVVQYLMLETRAQIKLALSSQSRNCMNKSSTLPQGTRGIYTWTSAARRAPQITAVEGRWARKPAAAAAAAAA
jgi:hypothetical protein